MPIFTNVFLLYYHTIFEETRYRIILIKYFIIQKRKRLAKLFHKMNKLENSTLTKNASHLPKFN